MANYIFTETAPEETESPIYDDDRYNGFIATGNRYYCDYGKSDLLDLVHNFVKYREDIIAVVNANTNAEDITDTVRDWMDIPENIDWDSVFSVGDEEKECAKLLSAVTSEKYLVREIHGSVQGDWQVLYFPASDEDLVDWFEAEYFNLGTEWSDEEGIAYYLMPMDEDDTRKELANRSGCRPEEVILRKFKGYEKTPIYEASIPISMS